MQNVAHGNYIDNNDMHIPQVVLTGMPSELQRAMGATEISDAFNLFEAEAIREKKIYDFLGKLALALLMVALAIATLKIIGLALGSAIPAWLTVINSIGTHTGSVVGPLPLLIGMYLKLAKSHEKWQSARFKAERIRQWKFQQILSGPYISKLSAPPSQGQTNQPDPLAKEFGEFLCDINMGTESVLRNFIQNPDFEPAFPIEPYADQNMAEQAFEVYIVRRLQVQLRWFTHNEEKYKKADSWTETAARNLLVGGAFFTLLEPILQFFKTGTPAVNDIWLPGLGILLTILSAGVRVYRSASGVSESAERYQSLRVRFLQFHTMMQLLRQRGGNQKEQLALFTEIEHALHTELVEFLRVTMKSDYLL